ncbi:hypothetical protein [Streptomyces sp. CoH27]|uniref:hypothetical protein n=1 Tax=Streptomyces sp. CoH27 TaxID=2875763 RepID=UPI001CD46F7B|nr:hypothetical protein [Streptomyces sp. CoH27]
MNRTTRTRASVITATALAATTLTAGAGVAGAKEAPKPKATKAPDLYAKDAVVLPTVSHRIRTDHAGIVDYFEHLLQNKPVGRKIESIVNVLDRRRTTDRPRPEPERSARPWPRQKRSKARDFSWSR